MATPTPMCYGQQQAYPGCHLPWSTPRPVVFFLPHPRVVLGAPSQLSMRRPLQQQPLLPPPKTAGEIAHPKKELKHLNKQERLECLCRLFTNAKHSVTGEPNGGIKSRLGEEYGVADTVIGRLWKVEALKEYATTVDKQLDALKAKDPSNTMDLQTYMKEIGGEEKFKTSGDEPMEENFKTRYTENPKWNQPTAISKKVVQTSVLAQEMVGVSGEDDGNKEEKVDDVTAFVTELAGVGFEDTTDQEPKQPPNGNVLMLGMAYAATAEIEKEELKIIKEKLRGSPQEQVAAIRQLAKVIATTNILRDTVRLLLTEEVCGVNAYAVSNQEGRPYVPDRDGKLYDPVKNIIANFTSHRTILPELKSLGVQFDQIILDYYYIPKGSWQMEHWEGLLKIIVEILLQGHLAKKSCVYLPFTVFLLDSVLYEIKNNGLLEHFNVRFIEEKDLTKIKLWKASRCLDPDVHYRELGFHVLEQEETSCNIDKKQVDGNTTKNTKEELHAFAQSIFNIGKVRFICLEKLEEGEIGNIHGIEDKSAGYDVHVAPPDSGQKNYNLEPNKMPAKPTAPKKAPTKLAQAGKQKQNITAQGKGKKATKTAVKGKQTLKKLTTEKECKQPSAGRPVRKSGRKR